MNEDHSLNEFGQILIQEVRDSTLKRIESIMLGKIKSSNAIALHEKIAILNSPELVMEIATEVVDAAIFRTLRLFESNERFTLIFNGTVDINEISDGLSGEIFGDQGWIENYSKYPPSDR